MGRSGNRPIDTRVAPLCFRARLFPFPNLRWDVVVVAAHRSAIFPDDTAESAKMPDGLWLSTGELSCKSTDGPTVSAVERPPVPLTFEAFPATCPAAMVEGTVMVDATPRVAPLAGMVATSRPRNAPAGRNGRGSEACPQVKIANLALSIVRSRSVPD